MAWKSREGSGHLRETASFSVFMLRCADGTIYTGMTRDLGRRVAEHNSGRGSKHTRERLPVRLAYAEVAGTRGVALRRESEIKRLSRRAKLLLCSSRPLRHATAHTGLPRPTDS